MATGLWEEKNELEPVTQMWLNAFGHQSLRISSYLSYLREKRKESICKKSEIIDMRL